MQMSISAIIAPFWGIVCLSGAVDHLLRCYMVACVNVNVVCIHNLSTECYFDVFSQYDRIVTSMREMLFQQHRSVVSITPKCYFDMTECAFVKIK